MIGYRDNNEGGEGVQQRRHWRQKVRQVRTRRSQKQQWLQRKNKKNKAPYPPAGWKYRSTAPSVSLDTLSATMSDRKS